MQYGKAMGMRVIAVDGGDAKGKMVKELGAEHYIDFKNVQDIAAEVMKITTVHGKLWKLHRHAANEVTVWRTRRDCLLSRQTGV